MGRVSLALLLLAVWLMPTYSAAQSNSLPLTAFGPTYERVPRSSRQVVPGWYAVGDASDVVDLDRVTQVDGQRAGEVEEGAEEVPRQHGDVAGADAVL